MVAVAIREPLLKAASRDQPVRTDGGVTFEVFGGEDEEEECWCGDHDFPDFDYYGDGRHDLQGEDE